MCGMKLEVPRGTSPSGAGEGCCGPDPSVRVLSDCFPAPADGHCRGGQRALDFLVLGSPNVLVVFFKHP